MNKHILTVLGISYEDLNQIVAENDITFQDIIKRVMLGLANRYHRCMTQQKSMPASSITISISCD